MYVSVFIYINIFIWHGRKSTYINANIHEHRYPQQTHKQTKKKHNCRHTHIRTNTHIQKKNAMLKKEKKECVRYLQPYGILHMYLNINYLRSYVMTQANFQTKGQVNYAH